MTLGVRDHMTLRIAFAHYRFPAARESDALELVGMRPAIFHRHVLSLIDRPGALMAYPQDVPWLQRLRDRRRRARAS